MHAHPRHLNQQCRYSMCASYDINDQDFPFRSFESGLGLASGEKGKLCKILVPVSERLTALKSLDLMNINAFSLFGSEDHMITTVARRELLFHDRD